MRHIFGQIERHSVFGDLRPGQRAALAVALVGTITALVSGQSLLHLALAGACAAGGCVGRVRPGARAGAGGLGGHPVRARRAGRHAPAAV